MQDSGLVFSDAVLSNIEEIKTNRKRWFDIGVCEIAQLADEAAEYLAELQSLAGAETEDIIDILGEELSSARDGECRVFERGRFFDTEAYFSVSDSVEQAIFSAILLEKLEGLKISLSEVELLKSRPCDESFTYLKNSLSDEAYDVFSQEFEDPRVAYSDSFKAAASAASDKKVGYCILPFEEKGGGRAAGFLNLIFAHDLKIVAVTSVLGFDGNADVKYALLSSEFNIPDYEPGDDRYLEFLLPQSESVELGSVMTAANVLAASVYRVNTVTLDSDEEIRNYYHLVLKTQEKSFSVILIYLSLFCRGYIPIGLYKNLE